MPFVVCYATALILILVYNPHPSRPFRFLVSSVHRVSGLCLLLLPLATAIQHRRDVRLYARNVRQAWRWSRDDVRWLALIGPAARGRKVSLPHQGKFNAGEKINFMVLTATYPLYILTGLVIWFGGVPYVSWLAHFSLALMVTPLVFGHILMATVNPDTRPGLSGMISGLVDREWAGHHYHHWYEEHYGDGAAAGAADAVRDAPPPVVVPAPSWVRARGSLLGVALFAPDADEVSAAVGGAADAPAAS